MLFCLSTGSHWPLLCTLQKLTSGGVERIYCNLALISNTPNCASWWTQESCWISFQNHHLTCKGPASQVTVCTELWERAHSFCFTILLLEPLCMWFPKSQSVIVGRGFMCFRLLISVFYCLMNKLQNIVFKSRKKVFNFLYEACLSPIDVVFMIRSTERME